MNILTTVYPNPATDILHISTDDYTQSTIITDITGRIAYRNSNTPTAIDITDFAAGTYFVKVGYKMFKIIKN